MYSISHVIFDLDGLLINSEQIYETCYQLACDKFNVKYTWEIQKRIMGLAAIVGCEILVEELHLPISAQEFLDSLLNICTHHLPNCKLMAGAERLVKHLHRHQIPIAVATSSSARSTKLKISRHQEFFELFEQFISAVDEPKVQRAKPYPDIFQFCASNFRVPPAASENVLVLEDSINGVKAAVAAGMPVIMIPDPRIDRKFTESATLVLNSIEDFVPQDFGLPAYDN